MKRKGTDLTPSSQLENYFKGQCCKNYMKAIKEDSSQLPPHTISVYFKEYSGSFSGVYDNADYLQDLTRKEKLPL